MLTQQQHVHDNMREYHSRAINLDEPQQRDFWIETLGVSEVTIRRAMESVGNDMVKVKRHLGI